jgi:TonB family protein
MFFYILQVTLSMAAFYAFYYIALRRETFFGVNRFYLLSTLVLSLILPFLHLDIAQNVIQPELMPTVILLENSFVTFSQKLSSSSLKGLEWTDLFLAIYLAGLLWMAVRLYLALRQINRISANGQSAKVNGHDCILSEDVKSPFSFFNTIFLPADHNYKDDELSEVIAHENAHIAERHSYDVFMMEIVTMLCWLNPFIYLYKKSLTEVHEYTADQAVLKFSNWENYAELLVRQQFRQLPNALSHQLIYSQLKNRLRMMTRKPSGRIARLKYLGVIPALFISLILFSFTYQSSSITNSVAPVQLSGIVDADLDMPVFPGCEDIAYAEQKQCTSTKLMEYVGNNLVYPKSLQKKGIEGKVIARFVVGSNGKVKDISIVKPLHKDADLAVLNLLKQMNEKAGVWKPATKDGKAVASEMHLPVVFQFDSEE